MKFYKLLIIEKHKMKSNGWSFWPFIAIREDKVDDVELLQHEEDHLKQQLYLLYFPWIFLYGIFWFVLTVAGYYGYERWKRIPFEAHASETEDGDFDGGPYGWFKYIFKMFS